MKRPIVSLNGTRLTGPDSRLHAHPGRPNYLTVAIDDLGSEPWSVVLERFAPDGRVRSETQLIGPPGSTEFDIGPLAVPAIYEYEAGVVYRKGYRLVISVFVGPPNDRRSPDVRYELHQGCTQDRDVEWFFPGKGERVPYTDGWIPEGETWNPFEFSGRPMNPPIDLRLGSGVLIDQNDVLIRYRLRHDSPELSPIDGILTGRNAADEPCLDPMDVTVEPAWQEVVIDAVDWPAGEYSFELQPKTEGVLDEGPIITYRRRADDPKRVLISPLAPYALVLDDSRPCLDVDSWAEVDLPPECSGADEVATDGRSILRCGDFTPDRQLALPFKLKGTYAIYLEAIGPVHINCGDGLIRAVAPRHISSDPAGLGPVFVCARDMTDSTIDVFAAQEDAAIGRLRLVPIEVESLERFQNRVRHTPLPLRGVSDWWVYFLGSGFQTSYLEEDQFDTILAGQREVGLSSEAWAIGRSWVTYRSDLPRASIYPCHPIPEETLRNLPNLAAVERMVNDFDALGYPLKRRANHDTQIYNWLGMNRHYAGARGWSHTSPWVRGHPELHLRNRDGSADGSRVEYHFEETRSERLDICLESSRFRPDGLVLGWCRQPPHAGYHPDILRQYEEESGIDPLSLGLSDDAKHTAWLKWRCEHGTTRFMRDLRRAMNDLEEKTGHHVPIVARIPSEGFFFNLAMGMDVETWIEEELVDELQLDPLENRGGNSAALGSQDVTPYVEACREHGIVVLGGVNGTTATRDLKRGAAGEELKGPDYAPTVGLRRAIGLADAGVDGIEVYESELFAYPTHARWLVPLFGHPSDTRAFLNESNLESVYPITASNATRGHDNHWMTGHCLPDSDGLPRGARHEI